MTISLKDAKKYARLVKEKEKRISGKREEKREREERVKDKREAKEIKEEIRTEKKWAAKVIERRLDDAIKEGKFQEKKKEKITIKIRRPNCNEIEDRLFAILRCNPYRKHIEQLLWMKYKGKGWDQIRTKYYVAPYEDSKGCIISLIKL